MLLVDVAELLVASPPLTPVAAVDGVTLFVGRLPHAPNTCYVLREYGGRPREKTHSGTSRRFSRFQLVCRDPDPVVARQMAEAAYRRFDSFIQADLGSPPVTYETIVPLAEPFPLDNDDAARVVIACNYEVWHQS
jgi:hypothetical protein